MVRDEKEEVETLGNYIAPLMLEFQKLFPKSSHLTLPDCQDQGNQAGTGMGFCREPLGNGEFHVSTWLGHGHLGIWFNLILDVSGESDF